jgi:hypothetical protein
MWGFLTCEASKHPSTCLLPVLATCDVYAFSVNLIAVEMALDSVCFQSYHFWADIFSVQTT